MRKAIFILIGIVWFPLVSMACDLCSIYLNLEPNDLKNTIGLNYRYRHFYNNVSSSPLLPSRDKHAAGQTLMGDAKTQEEVYINYDLWVNYFVGQKWQINATATFADNYYYENDSNMHNISGVGDIRVLGKYMLYNSKATDSTN